MQSVVSLPLNVTFYIHQKMINYFRSVARKCPYKYQERPGTGYCYRLFENHLKAGTDAETKCNSDANGYPGTGHLASIRENNTLAWIMNAFQARLSAITNG